MIKQTLLFTATAASALAMHIAEININQKDIEGSVRFDMGQFNDAIEPESYLVGGRIIDVDKDHSDAADPDPLLEANFLLQNPLQVNDDISFGIGVKAVYTKLNSKSYSALPLGVEAAYRLPVNTAIPVRVGASLYYAPESLSFNSAEGYAEQRIYADVEIVKNGSITVGFRNIETDTTQADLTYNDEFYIGFKFAF
jgi:hypothetical protein